MTTELMSMSFVLSDLLAYIGPGIGGGAIAAVVGVISAILLGLFSVLYYPIKRVLKKKKKGAADASAVSEGSE